MEMQSSTPSIFDKTNEKCQLIRQHFREIKEHKDGVFSILKFPPTESAPDETAGLSEKAEHKLSEAIQILANLSQKNLAKHASFSNKLKPLFLGCTKTLARGRNIILLGCGAAGRAVQLIRGGLAKPDVKFTLGKASFRNVRGGIAGWDGALIRSLEKFEDSPEYGVKQIKQLGIESGDTVILLSASGSAANLKGIMQHIAKLNQDKSAAEKIHCYFVINNPVDPELAKTFAKDTDSIHILSFPEVAQQGIAGSTRMQAANFQILLGTVLFDAIESVNRREDIFHWEDFCSNHLTLHRQVPFGKVEPIIVALTEIHRQGKGVNIVVDPDLAGVLTGDTTELAPTFTTPSVPHSSEKELVAAEEGKSFPGPTISVRGAKTSEEGWKALLGADPSTPIAEAVGAGNWVEEPKTNLNHILGYDLSHKTASANRVNFDIGLTGNTLCLKLPTAQVEIPLGDASSLGPLQGFSRTQIIKDILNIVSTLTMGRLQKYYSNLMTHVNPSNRKLVSRGIRLVFTLLMQAEKLDAYKNLHAVMQKIKERSLEKKFLMYIMQVFYRQMLQPAGDTPIVIATAQTVAAEIRALSSEEYLKKLSSLELTDIEGSILALEDSGRPIEEPEAPAKVLGVPAASTAAPQPLSSAHAPHSAFMPPRAPAPVADQEYAKILFVPPIPPTRVYTPVFL